MRFAALSLRRFILLLKDAILGGNKNVKENEQVLSFFIPFCVVGQSSLVDRPPTHLEKIDKPSENLKLFKADLLDYSSLRSAIEGCQGIFHAATLVPSTAAPNHV